MPNRRKATTPPFNPATLPLPPGAQPTLIGDTVTTPPTAAEEKGPWHKRLYAAMKDPSIASALSMAGMRLLHPSPGRSGLANGLDAFSVGLQHLNTLANLQSQRRLELEELARRRNIEDREIKTKEKDVEIKGDDVKNRASHNKSMEGIQWGQLDDAKANTSIRQAAEARQATESTARIQNDKDKLAQNATNQTNLDNYRKERIKVLQDEYRLKQNELKQREKEHADNLSVKNRNAATDEARQRSSAAYQNALIETSRSGAVLREAAQNKKFDQAQQAMVLRVHEQARKNVGSYDSLSGETPEQYVKRVEAEYNRLNKQIKESNAQSTKK